MGWSACRRVLCGDAELMFVDMIAVQMVEVSVMQIIGVTIMDHGRMSAVRSMLMGMMLMDEDGPSSEDSFREQGRF